jgi:hypothetical protein
MSEFQNTLDRYLPPQAGSGVPPTRRQSLEKEIRDHIQVLDNAMHKYSPSGQLELLKAKSMAFIALTNLK